MNVYVMLDDQSNHSLARYTFFDMFNIYGDTSPYILRTYSGTTGAHGRRVSGFIVQSADEEVQLLLPPLIECDSIPKSRNEIPTPEAASHHPHPKAIAHMIPPLDPSAEILTIRQICHTGPQCPQSAQRTSERALRSTFGLGVGYSGRCVPRRISQGST